MQHISSATPCHVKIHSPVGDDPEIYPVLFWQVDEHSPAGYGAVICIDDRHSFHNGTGE